MAKAFQPESTDSSSNNNNMEQLSSNSNLRSGLSLPINQMAIPIYTAPPPSREDVQLGGQILFQNFLHEQLENVGIQDDPFQGGDPPTSAFYQNAPTTARAQAFVGRPISPVASTPDGYTNAQWSHMGADLREIADQFASSKERTLIRHQADQVDLNHINEERFFNLLEEIFKNGVSKHRIVALFFFCSDVLIRCLKSEFSRLGTQLFLWSLRFILDRVCQWVYDNGGWERVFSNIWTVAIRVATLTTLCVVIGCGLVYMKKNWK